MKKAVLALLASLALQHASYADSIESLTPERFMHHYLQTFNDENLTEMQALFDFPHIKTRNGRVAHFDDRSVPAIDFAPLKRIGWKYSRIHFVKVHAETPQTAVVEMNFSRYTAEDKELMRQSSFYNLTKRNGYWQILALHDLSPPLSPPLRPSGKP